ncbi:MAG: hypothetical protein Q4F83_03330 [Eubacteriales bacterium]|nr:hypothetical protein [Eubacteriales bacterium]
MKKAIYFLLPAFFLFTVSFPEISFSAAANGLILWYESLVPALFPVMILSNLLLNTGMAYCFASFISPPFEHFLGISPFGVYALLTGFLCGCPMGAKTLADMRAQNLISKHEASYLVLFCNNISPAFLTNYLVLKHLDSSSRMIPTLTILYGAPVLFGLFSNHRYRSIKDNSTLSKNKTSPTAIQFDVVDVCISDSIVNITKLGSYVVLFSMIVTAIGCIPFLNQFSGSLLAGLLEVSNGIHMASALPVCFEFKYMLQIAYAAFGGLCCIAQSSQMLKTIGIPVTKYISGKISITVIALLMTLCYLL